jgi:hypothetical protein
MFGDQPIIIITRPNHEEINIYSRYVKVLVKYNTSANIEIGL